MVAQEHSDHLAKYLQLQGFTVWDVEILSEGVSRPIKVVRLRNGRGFHECGECGRRHQSALFEESEPVRFRDASLGDYPTYLEIHPARVACCGGTRRERFPFEAPGHRMTVRFFERVAALSTRMPVSVVASMAKLSWDTVQRIDAAATAKAAPQPDVRTLRLRWIGVDEVSWTGGRRYFTVVTDLESGRVVWIGDGKGEKGLQPFLEALTKKQRRRIRGVVSDLGYAGVVTRQLPRALRILDRFHIVQWMNRALNEVRRTVFGRAPRSEGGKQLKAKRWLVLGAREKLKHKDKLLLHRLMAENEPLYQAYLLKEELRALLRHPWTYLGALRRNLLAWIEAMRQTERTPLIQVADRLAPHIESILDGFRFGLRLGLVESINGKIVALRVQARGFRNPEYYKLKIYQRCNLADNPWATIIL